MIHKVWRSLVWRMAVAVVSLVSLVCLSGVPGPDNHVLRLNWMPMTPSISNFDGRISIGWWELNYVFQGVIKSLYLVKRRSSCIFGINNWQ
ncbi:uncharacterized protein BJX67DRAFT_354353 [Aspergillus lucknowensis]|uniref:Uncharacterized protein n=1 Tax=Aspergillus lucknowensis TaxID=176173 RepID=A0ABR4LQS1_9EURO